MIAVVVIVIALCVGLFLLWIFNAKSTSFKALDEIDQRLMTYRKIRQFLGIHILTAYPSLIQQDLRMKLLKQMKAYDEIGDDDSETRWECLWMPKMMQVVDDLQTSSVSRQDTEFAEALSGFRTNELLIDDAKQRRHAVSSRLALRVGHVDRERIANSYTQ